ncbi:hypothetical protein LOD99_8595 [Oopsacas minuta]|uniref:Uncharacterized protein n=1 Tax=Oopsacas minuta TaxID=111878 RepID=A0AAV7JH15_9METZ|nr:hypothetical protein LOD99_8595 [Oopsacas minuta]
MDKGRKVNWTKEVEYTLIEAIQDAGAPTTLPSHTEISESREVTPVFEGPEVTVVNSRPEGRRRRKRSIEQSTKVSDLLPLQREVLLKQIEVFSAQLQLIEEQREYYRHKKQRLLEKDLQQHL